MMRVLVTARVRTNEGPVDVSLNFAMPGSHSDFLREGRFSPVDAKLAALDHFIALFGREFYTRTLGHASRWNIDLDAPVGAV